MNKTWICDNCGASINCEEHGWVEWLTRKDGDGWSSHGLRLVHHVTAVRPNRCQYDEREENRRNGCHVGDLPLKSFLGDAGLMKLLSFVALGELPKDEVLEMIKRLHIDGYEHARNSFDRAISLGVFEPNTIEGFYPPKSIQAVLEFLKEEAEEQEE